MPMIRVTAVSAVLAACLNLLAVAQQNTRTADPIIGTWKLNLGQSRFATPAFTPKEHVEIYRELPDGRIELQLTRTMSDGSANNFKGTWPAQGGVVLEQANALKGPLFVETLVAPGEWWVTQTLDGKQMATIHKLVSGDGKTMRQVIKGVDPTGKPFEQVQVLDRQ